MLLTWTILKGLIGKNILPYKYLDLSDGNYYIFAVDQPFEYQAIIPKDGGLDQIDFETNYKSLAQPSISQLDIDGAEIVRIKAAKKGWSYFACPVEFVTAIVGGNLFSKLNDNVTDRGWFTISTYDATNTLVTNPANNATITKTILDFEPNCDYEVIGGELRTLQNITSDVRMWIIAVPDIPAASGGSKEMVGGINLRYLIPGNVYTVDGRVTKALTYNATYHTGKIRVILQYPAGLQEQLSITIEMYKQ